MPASSPSCRSELEAPALDSPKFQRMKNIVTVADEPWMAVAKGEIGTTQYPIGQSNPRITQYHSDTNICGYDDKASWCSSFVNWCLGQTGVHGTRSALARSWLDWGVELALPIPGCIAVLSRDDPNSWKGHVGFYLRHNDEYVYLLGGNQLEQVREHFYPIGSVLSYRWPKSSYLAGMGGNQPR